MKLSRRDYIRELTAETVAVHISDGTSIRGVLTGAYSDVVVLRHASYLTEGSEVPIDGEALVPRSQIVFIQRVDA